LKNHYLTSVAFTVAVLMYKKKKKRN